MLYSNTHSTIIPGRPWHSFPTPSSYPIISPVTSRGVAVGGGGNSCVNLCAGVCI